MRPKKPIAIPVSIDVDITSGSGSYSYMIALFKASNKNFDNFLCNSYVNYYFDNSYLDIYEQDYNFVSKKIFNIKHYDIHSFLVMEKFDEAIQSIYEHLSDGFSLYVELCVSRSQIIGNDGECIEDNRYCLLYKMDMEKSRVGLLTIYGERFLEFSLSFDELKEAIYKSSREIYHFDFKKVNLECKNEIDVQSVIADLNDYVSSKCRKVYFPGDKVFGFEATTAMKEYIINMCDEILAGSIEKLPVGNVKVLNDHKKLMYRRLKTLEAAQLITADNWATQYTKTKESAEKLVEVCESFSIRPTENTKQDIVSLYDTIYKNEHIVLTNLCKGGFKE